MVGWEVPIGAAIAFTGGVLEPGLHSPGSVLQEPERLPSGPRLWDRLSFSKPYLKRWLFSVLS